MKLLLLRCALLTLGFGFLGCPHQVMERVEKLIPPKGYKPVYSTSSVSFKKISEQYSERVRKGEIDTSALYDEMENYEVQQNTDSIFIAGLSTRTDSVQSDSTLVNPSPSLESSQAVNSPSEKQTVAKHKRTIPLRFQFRGVSDKAYPQEIVLRASVLDSAGRYISGLAPPKFMGSGNYRDYWRTLTDSCHGNNVAIDSFSVVEVRDEDADPYAVAFVIDQSGSMGDVRISRLREAVKRTLGILSRKDMATVIPFAGGVKVEIPLTGDSAVLRTFNQSQVKLRGGTSIYDAVDVASKELTKAPDSFKRAILLFTDGEDVTSKLALSDACRIARERNTPVYAIAYGITDEEPLEKLARLTHGKLYRIYSTAEFPYVFADIYRSLKNYYRIAYHPPPCNGLHHVTASLSVPELGVRRVLAKGVYDKSLFTELDTVGTIAFVSIEFETGKAIIQRASMPAIENVASALKNSPSIIMEIRGHTDNRGADEPNKKLSEQRADAVAEALAKFGIERRRLQTHGFGSTRPLASNDTEENRARNRRTEFVIVKK